MADYRALIRTETETGAAVDPGGFSIRHHTAGSAHLEMSRPTGGHLLHAAVGMCIFNDTLALATKRSIRIDRLQVDVEGDFAGDFHYVSTGITYHITIDSPADRSAIDSLIGAVVDDASIPRSIQQGTPVMPGRVTLNPDT